MAPDRYCGPPALLCLTAPTHNRTFLEVLAHGDSYRSHQSA